MSATRSSPVSPLYPVLHILSLRRFVWHLFSFLSDVEQLIEGGALLIYKLAAEMRYTREKKRREGEIELEIEKTLHLAINTKKSIVNKQ